VRQGESLLEVLRERCGIASLKDGCQPQGQCGCCLAIVDGQPKVTRAEIARALDAAQVRKADTLGCWIVQNPRSNRHNEVGYPRALAESARVALGTDGFVSDMREEMSVLFADALLHGEDATVVGRRAAAGQALVAAICDFSGDRPAAPEISDLLMNEIRAEAQEAAAILWTRMAEL